MLTLSTLPLVRWLGWEHNDARMPLVMALWTLVLFNRRFFLYTAPPWIAVALASQMDDTDLQRWLDRRLSAIIVGWLAWMASLSILGTTLTIWLLGCGCLSWKSPWANLIRAHLQTAKKKEQIYPMTGGAPIEERLFQFVAIEHQRWLVGWTDRLLPHDRPAWSDDYQEAVPPTDEFTLPPPCKAGYWGWVDEGWRLENHGNVADHDGWEYTQWDWSPISSRWLPLRLTRRRRWVRCARWEMARPPKRPETFSIKRTASCNSSRTTSTTVSTSTTTTTSTTSSHFSNASTSNSLLSAITSFSNSSTCASTKAEPTTALSTGPIEIPRIRPEMPCV